MFLSFLSYVRCPFAILYCLLSFVFWATVFVVGSLFIKRANFGTMSQAIWCRGILWSAGLTVKVEGVENIPKNGALFFFNHTSLLDIPVVVAALPINLRFVAKKELFKIPFFGYAMKTLGTLPVNRSSHVQAMEMYQQAAQRVRGGLYIALAPEGGRQMEHRIGEFKSGPFILAMRTQLPIIPLVINGAGEALPKRSIGLNCGQWKREIGVRVLPTIDVAGYDFDSRKQLKEKVRCAMIQAFDELQS